MRASGLPWLSSLNHPFVVPTTDPCACPTPRKKSHWFFSFPCPPHISDHEGVKNLLMFQELTALPYILHPPRGCMVSQFPDSACSPMLPQEHTASSACTCHQEAPVWWNKEVREDPLKELTACSSIPAWRSPWTEEPSGLQSMGSRRVRRDWALMQTDKVMCDLNHLLKSDLRILLITTEGHKNPNCMNMILKKWCP